MGLDTSHDCFHGSYSSFKHWRHTIAKAAGYWVAPLQYANGDLRQTIILDWAHLPPGHLLGEWDEIPSDPLLILLTHQDCEGKIKSEHCTALADALEATIPNLPDDKFPNIDCKELTRQFISGLRQAAQAGEDVEFH